MVIQITPQTVEEFDVWVLLSPQSDQSFEFIGGKVIEVVSNSKSSRIAMLIGTLITLFVQANKLGRTTGADGGYMVNGERYIPDVAFISYLKQPHEPNAAYNPMPPDLAVEVLSPSNDAAEIRIKIVNYLAVGTFVWVIDADKKQCEVYKPDAKPLLLGIDDILDGGEVLPGFKLALKDIFEA